MPIADDWTFIPVPFTAGGYRELVHVDGVLSYDANTGTAPGLNDYVIDGNGAVGRVVGGSDLGGTNATGTLTLTSVVGRFANNATLRVLSDVPFDTVGGTPQGFALGDTVTGPTTESIDVKAVEYNSGPKVSASVPGQGVIYGDSLTAGFGDGEQLDVSGGATAVALVNGTGTDNSALFATCLVNGDLVPPGTADTNDSKIVHYDAGSLAIPLPVEATVSDTTTGATGVVQQVEGTEVVGSLRLIDMGTSGVAFTDNNGLDVEDVVNWNAQVAGQVFQVGSVYEGQTSGFRFRVLAILDDGDNTGALITAGKEGVLTLNEDIHLILPGDTLGLKVAQVENTTATLAVATINIPNGARTEQYAAAGVSQGGIYGPTRSLNIRRRSNELLTYSKQNFKLLANMQHPPALDGDVKNSLYTVRSSDDWQIPDLSYRFLEDGAWKDEGNDNVWNNYQSGQGLFTGVDITDEGFLQAAANPTPMPTGYPEQGGSVLDQFWLEGPFDAIVKVKSNADVQLIDVTVEALGQEIAGTVVTWFTREYLRLSKTFQAAPALAAVVAVPLDAKNDPDNNTGQYDAAFTAGGAGAFTVGEKFSTSDGTKVGIVTSSDSGATGNITYALKSGTQFVNTDVVTGDVSAKTATLATPTNVVAGYGTDIRIMAVQVLADSTPQAVVTGTFFVGESVTQATTGATGFLLHHDTVNDTLYIQVDTGTFSGDNNITGDSSAASWNPGVTTQTYNTQTTVPKDLGEGSGDNNYAGVLSGDVTGGSAQAIQKGYEWSKFLTAKESAVLQARPGTLTPVEGRVFRQFDPAFAEKDVAPYGNFAGGKMEGIEGLFIQKETLDAADLQNFTVLPIGAALALIPPNLQSLIAGQLQAGFNVSGNRATGTGSEDVLVTEFQAGAGNAAGNSVIVLQAGARAVGPTPADVPDAGVVEVEDPNSAGNFLLFPYNAVDRSTDTYTLTSGTIGDVTGGSALTQGDDAYVTFFKETATGASVSASIQFVSSVDCVVQARKEGFDDFIGVGVFGPTGLTVPVVKTVDGVEELP